MRAAGKGQNRDVRPPRLANLGAATAKNRIRRSRLYLPGNESKFMMNAGVHGPDGVILDLEDSVHPAAKEEARLVVRNALRCVDFGTCERMVRINQLPLGLKDLGAIVPESPDLILIPKVEHVDQIKEVDAAITELQRQTDSKRALWLMPILESALGIENTFEIATASPRVAALTIGLEDYPADLGVPKTADGLETWFARARLVNAAKAAGIQAIDSVYASKAWAAFTRGRYRSSTSASRLRRSRSTRP